MNDIEDLTPIIADLQDTALRISGRIPEIKNRWKQQQMRNALAECEAAIGHLKVSMANLPVTESTNKPFEAPHDDGRGRATSVV